MVFLELRTMVDTIALNMGILKVCLAAAYL